MTLQAHVLPDDALRVVDGGFELEIHLNWYRSLPLSSIALLELTVAGETIPSGEVTLCLNGNEYPLGELAEHWEEYWFVLDAATLRVRRPLACAGEPVEVGIRLGSRIPYLPIGPTQAVLFVTERSQVLTAG